MFHTPNHSIDFTSIQDDDFYLLLSDPFVTPQPSSAKASFTPPNRNPSMNKFNPELTWTDLPFGIRSGHMEYPIEDPMIDFESEEEFSIMDDDLSFLALPSLSPTPESDMLSTSTFNFNLVPLPVLTERHVIFALSPITLAPCSQEKARESSNGSPENSLPTTSNTPTSKPRPLHRRSKTCTSKPRRQHRRFVSDSVLKEMTWVPRPILEEVFEEEGLQTTAAKCA